MTWHMFGMQLGVLEKIVRPVMVYVFIVVCLRVFGKRQLAQLNLFDMVVLMSISNTVQNAMIGDDYSVTGGLIGAFSMFLTNYLVLRYVFRHKTLDQLVEGKPTVLIENGEVQRDALAKELLSEPELEIAAARNGYESLDEVERCILEPGGVFCMRGKKRVAPPSPEILARLDRLGAQIEELKARLPAG